MSSDMLIRGKNTSCEKRPFSYLLSDSFFNNPYIYYLAWITYVFSILLFLKINGNILIDTITDADRMYLPTLFRDLFILGGHFSGWKVGGAPYFFPDMLLVFLFYGLFDNVIICFLLVGFLYLIILCVLWLKIGKYFVSSEIYGCFRLFVLFSLSIVLNSSTGFSFIQPHYAFLHFSNVLGFTLIMYLLLLIIDDKRSKNTKSLCVFFIIVISFLYSMSDAYFIVQVVLPITCVLFIYVAAFDRGALLFVKLGILLLFASSCGFYTYYSFEHYASIKIYWHPSLAQRDIINSLKIEYSWLRYFISEHKYHFTGCALSISLMVCCIIQKRLRNIPLLLLSLSIIASIIITVAFTTIAGSFIDNNSKRFLFPVTILPIYSFFIFLFLFLNKHKKTVKIITGLIVIIAIIRTMTAVDCDLLNSIKSTIGYYPDDIRCVEEYAKEKKYRYGMASYWNSKPLFILSKSHLILNQVLPTLVPRHWSNNIEWYLKYPADYIITNENDDKINQISEKRLLIMAGYPSIMKKCGKYSVYEIKKDEAYKYNKSINNAVKQYIEIQNEQLEQ